MSLRYKFGILLLGFLIILGANLLIHFFSHEGTSKELRKIESELFPERMYSENLLDRFEEIDNLFELAVLTGETSLITSNESERKVFLNNIENLAEIADADFDQEIAGIKELFDQYFEHVAELSLEMIRTENLEQSDNAEIGETLSAKAAHTSELRSTLRIRLQNLVGKTGGNLAGSLQEITKNSEVQVELSLIVSLFAILVVSVFLYFLYRAIVKPLSLLSSMTSDIAQGEFGKVSDIPKLGKDEIGNLADSFVRMGRNLQDTTISRDFFDKIIQTTADMLFVLDPELSIAMVNKATLDELGFSWNELDGQQLSSMVDPEWFSELTFVSRETESPICDHVETEFIRKNGSVVPVLFSCSTILDQLGNTQWFVCIASNITDRKQKEEAMRRAEQAAREQHLIQADKMTTLSILVSGVAHEVNNPNHIIASNVYFLKKAWDSAAPVLENYYRENQRFALGGIPFGKAKEQIPLVLSMIQGGSNRIKNIVKELRDYARQQPADMTEEVKLNALAESAATLMANLVKKATVNFSLALKDGTPSINGNYQRLEQVLINLLANSSQALTNNSQAIVVETDYNSEKDTVILRVRDEGMGMTEETMRRITDPFFTTKRETGGTGLGLSISANIVREHGGEIYFESTPGEGTTVIIELPVNPDKNKTTPAEENDD